MRAVFTLGLACVTNHRPRRITKGKLRHADTAGSPASWVHVQPQGGILRVIVSDLATATFAARAKERVSRGLRCAATIHHGECLEGKAARRELDDHSGQKVNRAEKYERGHPPN